jgi:hypothetical protein
MQFETHNTTHEKWLRAKVIVGVLDSDTEALEVIESKRLTADRPQSADGGKPLNDTKTCLDFVQRMILKVIV